MTKKILKKIKIGNKDPKEIISQEYDKVFKKPYYNKKINFKEKEGYVFKIIEDIPKRLLTPKKSEKLIESKAHKARTQERELLFLNEDYQKSKTEFRKKNELPSMGLYFPGDLKEFLDKDKKILPPFNNPYNSIWFLGKTKNKQKRIDQEINAIVEKFKNFLPLNIHSYYFIWNDFLYSLFLVPYSKDSMVNIPTHPESIIDPRYPLYGEEKKILNLEAYQKYLAKEFPEKAKQVYQKICLIEKNKILEFNEKTAEENFKKALNSYPKYQYSKSFEKLKIKSKEDLLKLANFWNRELSDISSEKSGIGWEEDQGQGYTTAYKYQDVKTGKTKYISEEKRSRERHVSKSDLTTPVGLVPITKTRINPFLNRKGEIPLTSIVEYCLINKVLTSDFVIAKEYNELLIKAGRNNEEGKIAKTKVKEIVNLYTPIVRKKVRYSEETPQMEEWARKAFKRMQEEIKRDKP